MFFDTHVHFDGFEEAGGAEAVVDRARAAGVGRMVAVGGSDRQNRFALDCAARFTGAVYAAVGYSLDCAGTEAAVQDLTGLDKAVAVGEVGLDFHYARETALEQERLFGRMLEVAREACLPVVVHSRDAEDATAALLQVHAGAWRGRPDGLGVLHCFTGSRSFADEALAMGFCISFSGIVTFKSAAELRSVAEAVPADRLLIETDAPLLTPEPFRGRGNEPAYVGRVAEVLAGVRNSTVAEIAAQTTANADRLFGIRG